MIELFVRNFVHVAESISGEGLSKISDCNKTVFFIWRQKRLTGTTAEESRCNYGIRKINRIISC